MATSNRNLFPHSYQGNVDSSSIMFISYYLLMQGLRGILVRPRKKTNMSLTIKVYCKKVSKDLIPKMMNRLNDYDMVVSVHPDFKFDAEEDSGYLPFKFRLKDPRLSILKDKELKSGFELYIDEFDLHTEKENLKPKMSFFDKLLGKKQMAGLIVNGRDPRAADERPQALPPRKGKLHLMRLLETLARVDLIDHAGLASLIQEQRYRLAWGTTLIVITGSANHELLDELYQARRSGQNAILILVGAVARYGRR